MGDERTCEACGKLVDENRVYFGVVGPFCSVPCRDLWMYDPVRIAADRLGRVMEPIEQPANPKATRPKRRP